MRSSTLDNSTQFFTASADKIEQSIENGAYEDVAASCVALVKKYPTQARGWRLLSRVALNLGKLRLAIDAALHAVQEGRTDTTNCALLARCYLRAHEWRNANKALHMAAQQTSEIDPDKLTELGTLLFEANQLEAALDRFNQALEIDRQHAPALYNRAAVLRFLGHSKESETDYRQLLAIQPNDFEACYNLLQLQAQQPAVELLEIIDRCMHLNPGNRLAEIYLSFAKGKYYEDLKHYEAAFQSYTHGAQLKRKHSDYDLSKDLQLMRDLPRLFKPSGDLGREV